MKCKKIEDVAADVAVDLEVSAEIAAAGYSSFLLSSAAVAVETKVVDVVANESFHINLLPIGIQ